MYQSISIDLLNLILSLSDALDLASPELSQHQLRTAFITWELGKTAGLSEKDMENLFIAALLHDVGALSAEDKISIHKAEVTSPDQHCILGERVLGQIAMFKPASEIVRYHHTAWQTWGNQKDPFIFHSQMLLLADTIERFLYRDKYILHQNEELVERIDALSGIVIHPEVVQMFKSVAVREDFWLDIVSPRLYSLLLHNGPSRGVIIDLAFLKEVSKLFRNMIDFRSPFTATHSSGVAASASSISRYFGLTEMEVELMEVTGNLHDLGKMAVPNAILNKPDKLTKEETAIMRQHTYFTYSVLNTIGGIQQMAEWAAFHHERLDGTGYPFHLDAGKLSIGARIMSVADVLTALAEDRPYRSGLSQDEVLDILKKMCEKGYLEKSVVRVLEENYAEIIGITMQKQAEARAYYEQEFRSLL